MIYRTDKVNNNVSAVYYLAQNPWWQLIPRIMLQFIVAHLLSSVLLR